jgi:uncharacterized membrane protein
MKIITIATPAVLAAAVSASCASVQEAAGPDARPRKADGVFLEETIISQGGQDLFYHVANLTREGSPYVKFLIVDEEGRDTTIFGAKGKLDFGAFKGTAELIGFDDTDNNHGIGVNARGKAGETAVGVALEKRVDAGASTEMATAYARHRRGDWEVTGGVSGVDGDARGIAALSHTSGQNMVGAAVTANGNGQGYATAVAGRMTEKRGEGTGCRVWGKVDLEDGDHLVEVIGGTKTNLRRPDFSAPLSPDSGMHDPKLFDNRFDAHIYLWERGNGFIGRAAHSDIGGVESASADVIYHWDVNGVLPRVSLGYSRVDGVDSVRGGVGATFKNSYFDVVVEGIEGEKPKVMAVAAAAYRF